ncbi:MAG: bacterioferritin [Bosea sp.]|jgi:bacterioferritin-associated ferredoxin|nr:bacterioferritin [Bosea sp. (in: a-proteobacteria)]
MIVCQCNVLTRADVLSVFAREHVVMPRTPAQVQRCLGCAPQCGCCASAVREILVEAGFTGCTVGCAACPGEGGADVANDEGGLASLGAPSRQGRVAFGGAGVQAS